MITKYISIILVSSVKFLISFPMTIGYEFDFMQTFILTSIGGILGVLFFAFLTTPIVCLWDYITDKTKGCNKPAKFIPPEFEYENEPVLVRKRIFTKKNKRIVKLKLNYGLLGIAIVTPAIISIPIGTFVAVRFYPNKKSTVPYLLISVICWALLLSYLSSVVGVRVFDFNL
jgi:hypothetical protein